MTTGAVPIRGRWRPTPPIAVRLVAGLALFGVGEGLLVVAGLGNSPWTVLAEGLAERTGASIGLVTTVVGALVLLMWWPLRQRPGLGTVANVLVVGTTVDVVVGLAARPGHPVLQVVTVLAGIAAVGLGSGLYLGTGMGPGPRDGLMTGLHRRTGRSLRTVRWGIEASVLVVGVLLGGTAGVGTLLFVLLIGPAVAIAVRLLSLVPTTAL